jgi:hypothetical protein
VSSPSPPSQPAPPPGTSYTITLTIDSTVADFNQAAQDSLASALSTFLGVALAYVEITSVTAASVLVESLVFETDASGAGVLNKINQASTVQLSNELGVTVESASVRETAASPPPSGGGGGGGGSGDGGTVDKGAAGRLGAEPLAQDVLGLSLETWIIIGACILAVLGLGLFCCLCYRCRQPKPSAQRSRNDDALRA